MLSFPSPLHLMPQTSGEHVLPERHSTILLFKAHRQCLRGAMLEFMDEQNPVKYDRIIALKFLIS